MSTSELERALLFQLRAAKAPEPVTEHPFAKAIGRKWRFDLAWPAHMLACEIEGGTWTGGRHSRGKGFEGDCEKASEAAILGWRVLRVTTDMVSDGRALGLIERALDASPARIQPNTATPCGSRWHLHLCTRPAGHPGQHQAGEGMDWAVWQGV